MLVPPGFMPGTGAGNALTMQMCHGAGPLPQGVRSPAGEGGQSPANHGHHEAPCVFAAAGTVAPPPVTLAIIDGVVMPETAPVQLEPVVMLRTQHRAHCPRAPPPTIRPA